MTQQAATDFVTIPILRGFTEIQALYNNVIPFGGMICGGYVRYCASPRWKPEPASDVDIYCKDENVFDGLKKHFEALKLEKRHENEVSFTYKHPKDGPYFYCPPIQLIKPVREGAIVAAGTVEEILSNFDFSVIRVAIISPTEVLADPHFLEDEAKRALRIKNIHCPISSTLRCMKYSRKGYWLRPFESLKLFLDWEGRSDDYRMKLREYLAKSEEDKKGGLIKEEVEELEALMRID